EPCVSALRTANLLKIGECTGRESHLGATEIACPAGHQRRNRIGVFGIGKGIETPPALHVGQLQIERLELSMSDAGYLLRAEISCHQVCENLTNIGESPTAQVWNKLTDCYAGQIVVERLFRLPVGEESGE